MRITKENGKKNEPMEYQPALLAAGEKPIAKTGSFSEIGHLEAFAHIIFIKLNGIVWLLVGKFPLVVSSNGSETVAETICNLRKQADGKMHSCNICGTGYPLL